MRKLKWLLAVLALGLALAVWSPGLMTAQPPGGEPPGDLQPPPPRDDDGARRPPPRDDFDRPGPPRDDVRDRGRQDRRPPRPEADRRGPPPRDGLDRRRPDRDQDREQERGLRGAHPAGRDAYPQPPHRERDGWHQEPPGENRRGNDRPFDRFSHPVQGDDRPRHVADPSGRRVPPPPPKPEELFSRFDKNGDGMLSKDEFVTGFAQLPPPPPPRRLDGHEPRPHDAWDDQRHGPPRNPGLRPPYENDPDRRRDEDSRPGEANAPARRDDRVGPPGNVGGPPYDGATLRESDRPHDSSPHDRHEGRPAEHPGDRRPD